MDPDNSLLPRRVLTDPYGTLWILMGPYELRWVLWDLDGSGPYRSIWFQTDPYGSIRVLMGQDGSFLIQTGLYGYR